MPAQSQPRRHCLRSAGLPAPSRPRFRCRWSAATSETAASSTSGTSEASEVGSWPPFQRIRRSYPPFGCPQVRPQPPIHPPAQVLPSRPVPWTRSPGLPSVRALPAPLLDLGGFDFDFGDSAARGGGGGVKTGGGWGGGGGFGCGHTDRRAGGGGRRHLTTGETENGHGRDQNGKPHDRNADRKRVKDSDAFVAQ